MRHPPTAGSGIDIGRSTAALAPIVAPGAAFGASDLHNDENLGLMQQIGGASRPLGMDAPVAGWPASLIAAYNDERVALVRLAALILGSRTLAEEVVHDAVISVLPHWGRADRPLAYLRTAVVNRARDVGQRTPPSDVVPESQSLPEDLVDLHRALLTLPVRQREAIVLRSVVGSTDAEIAMHLRCTRSTVRTLIARAIRALRKELSS